LGVRYSIRLAIAWEFFENHNLPPDNSGGEVVANQSLTNKTNYRKTEFLKKRGSSNAMMPRSDFPGTYDASD
jgi:hypothetical protein